MHRSNKKQGWASWYFNIWDSQPCPPPCCEMVGTLLFNFFLEIVILTWTSLLYHYIMYMFLYFFRQQFCSASNLTSRFVTLAKKENTVGSWPNAVLAAAMDHTVHSVNKQFMWTHIFYMFMHTHILHTVIFGELVLSIHTYRHIQMRYCTQGLPVF